MSISPKTTVLSLLSALCLTWLAGCVRTVGGRYLGDVWALHMDSWVWEAVSTSSNHPQVPGPFEDGKGQRPHVLPPCAGHVLVPWGSSLLCIGGHTKVTYASTALTPGLFDACTGSLAPRLVFSAGVGASIVRRLLLWMLLPVTAVSLIPAVNHLVMQP